MTAESREASPRWLLKVLPARDAAIPAGDPTGPAPLSASQERMWLLSQLLPDDGALALPMAVRLRGRLNLAALQQSLDDVVRRHDVLRSVVAVRDGRPVQLPGPHRHVPFRLVDLRGMDPDDAEDRVRPLLDREARRAFDLARGPLVRVTVLALGPADHVVAITVHHIAADGWSMAVLAAELRELYAALLDGRPCPLAGLPPVRYRDFARWQRDRRWAASQAYWDEELRDLPGGELPVARRGGTATYRSATWTCTLPPSLTVELRQLRRQAGGSLFMVVLTALLTLIHRLDGREDVVVGTLAAGRDRPELEHLIGVFVNVLVVRGRFTDRPAFSELWRRVRETCVSAYTHQDLPYETLLERLRARQQVDAPVRVLCVAQQPPPPLELAGLSARPVDVEHGSAQFDLVVEIRERSDTVRLAFKYDTDVFDEPTIRLLGGYLRALLNGVVADVDRPCAELPLPVPLPVPAATADASASVHEMFERQVVRTPDAVAITHRGAALSYRGLNAMSNRVARHLRSRGVGAGDRVGVCLPRSPESIAALLAVLKAGAAYVPLDPSYPADRLAYMVADSGARCVVTDSRHAGRLEDDVPAVVLDQDAAAIARRPAGDLTVPVGPDHVAYVIYTSGTTGDPKGVLASHRGAVIRFRWMWRAYPFEEGERCCQRTPLSFVDSVWETFGPLLAGVPVDVLDVEVVADPWRLVAALAAARVTRIVVVPSLLRAMLDAVPDLGDRLPGLRLWSVSGERLPADLVARFHAVLPNRRLLNLYGSAEVSADATAGLAGGAGERFVPIGRPIDGMTVTTVGDDGSAVPALVAGELAVSGAGLALGYHGRPAETAARFTPDPGGPAGSRAFRSGDLGRAWPDGTLEFLGRLDDQVTIRGYRVEPGEVEAALLRHPAVTRAAVAALPDAAGSATLTGYVVLGQPCPTVALTAFARTSLPPHLVPSALVVVDALPHTPSGKVDRRRLPSLEVVTPVADTVSPSTPAEHAVAAVYRELLPVPWTSVHDDFFALGGHSILAAAAVREVRRRCGVGVALRDLFDEPTIAGLAALVAGRAADSTPDGGPELRPRPEERYEQFPLTDVQQAYWIGRDPGFELGNVATHAYFEVDADALDERRFADAIQCLVRRHDALRTVVTADGEQRVLREVPPYRPAVLDLSTTDAADRLSAIRAEMSHQVLPADRWPLFDIRVTRLSSGRARIHVSIDALIADAYSVRLMMAELGQRYHDPTVEPAPLELTFRDCVVAERAARDSDGYRRALSYWRGRLADLPPGPELPLAREPGSVPDPRFRRLSRLLARPTWEKVTRRAADLGLTKAGLLLGVFSEVLTTWSRRPHYTVTLTLFNRLGEHRQLDSVIGDFTSLTLLEVDHRDGGGFAERARRTQARLWTDLDHRAVSGVTVLREWTRQRGGTPGLIAPVVFTSMLELGGGGPAVTDTLGTVGYGITQTPQLYLDHQVAETPDGLSLNWDVVADLFPEGLIDDMFAAYAGLLERLAVEPDAWHEPVRGVPPAAQRQRRALVNATATETPRSCLHSLVATTAADRPDAPAVVTPGRTLDYREMSTRAARVARRLRNLGVGRGQLVGIAMDKGWEQVVATLGVCASGAAYVPLDPDLPAERMAYLAGHTGIEHVLTQSWLCGRLPGLDRLHHHAVDLDERWPRVDGGLHTLPEDGDVGDLAYVIFTSGSTGTPKGVMIDHRGAVNTILDINRRFAIGPADRVLALSSLSFDLSVYDVFGTLAAGGTLVIPSHARRRDPAHWVELIRSEGVTVWNSVPALMSLAVDVAESLTPLRLAMLSGDWVPVRLPDRIRALAGAALVCSLGGATEASIWSVYYPVGHVEDGWTSIPYGRPLSNQRLYVLDDAFEPRPDWVAGDLHIGGPGLALGYWRDAARTARSFVTHPRTGERLYRTGDLARYRDDGDLEFLGREDLQVKVSGHRIELGEIETELAAIPGVAGCAVAAVGPREDKRLVAYYVPAAAGAPALRERLLRKLPDYLVPTTFLPVDRIPLTANGKVDRAALAATPPPERVPAAPDRDPSDLERSLALLWEEVLDVDHVEPHDNFFQLGGTSLVAVRLLSRLRAALRVDIPLPRLFESPTVAALADAIGQASAGIRTGPDEPATLRPAPAHRYEPFPLTEIQQAYWMGRRSALALGNVATHSYVELDVVDLDVDRLARVVGRLVDRHDALRTVVRPDGRQRVLADVPRYQLAHRDVRGLSPARADAVLAGARERMSHQVHAADEWPLFEIAAHRLDDRRTRLHVSLDLLVADARSFRILRRELLAMYHDPEVELPAVGCTFRDYVLGVEGLRGGDEHRRAETYWRGRLPELPPAPALPQVRDLAEIRQPVFERLSARLDAPSWATLRRDAARRNLTPSGVLCAAFAEVLALWSQQRRFVINLTTFNRRPLHPDVDTVVGDFTSTTLLAVDAAADTFATRAGRLQEQIFADLEHRAFGGVEVLRLLRRRSESRADAMAPVVFTSTLVPEPALGGEPPPWDVSPVYSVSQTPQVLLDHQVSEHDGELFYTWDHVAEAFPPGLVGDMFEAYGRLLHSLHSDGAYWKAGPAWSR